jgi:hypothetical protein
LVWYGRRQLLRLHEASIDSRQLSRWQDAAVRLHGAPLVDRSQLIDEGVRRLEQSERFMA